MPTKVVIVTPPPSMTTSTGEGSARATEQGGAEGCAAAVDPADANKNDNNINNIDQGGSEKASNTSSAKLNIQNFFIAAGLSVAAQVCVGGDGGGIFLPLGIYLLVFAPKPSSGLCQAGNFNLSHKKRKASSEQRSNPNNGSEAKTNIPWSALSLEDQRTISASIIATTEQKRELDGSGVGPQSNNHSDHQQKPAAAPNVRIKPKRPTKRLPKMSASTGAAEGAAAAAAHPADANNSNNNDQGGSATCIAATAVESLSMMKRDYLLTVDKILSHNVPGSEESKMIKNAIDKYYPADPPSSRFQIKEVMKPLSEVIKFVAGFRQEVETNNKKEINCVLEKLSIIMLQLLEGEVGQSKTKYVKLTDGWTSGERQRDIVRKIVRRKIGRRMTKEELFKDINMLVDACTFKLKATSEVYEADGAFTAAARTSKESSATFSRKQGNYCSQHQNSGNDVSKMSRSTLSLEEGKGKPTKSRAKRTIMQSSEPNKIRAVEATQQNNHSSNHADKPADVVTKPLSSTSTFKRPLRSASKTNDSDRFEDGDWDRYLNWLNYKSSPSPDGGFQYVRKPDDRAPETNSGSGTYARFPNFFCSFSLAKEWLLHNDVHPGLVPELCKDRTLLFENECHVIVEGINERVWMEIRKEHAPEESKASYHHRSKVRFFGEKCSISNRRSKYDVNGNHIGRQYKLDTNDDEWIDEYWLKEQEVAGRILNKSVKAQRFGKSFVHNQRIFSFQKIHLTF